MAHARKNAAQADRMEHIAAPPLALTITWRNGRIVSLGLRRAEAPRLDTDASETARTLHAALVRLAKGKCADFPELPLDWECLPPFTRQVLQALLAQVRHGETVTYGQLAALSGNAGKARAVGQAMARNPWPLVVPCHRVLGADGGLTGYTNPHGLSLKELLLHMESGRTRG